jgi:type IX secretion system PorP/SprF family membrane protein
MRHLYIIFLLVLNHLSAQELAVYSQYQVLPVLINPGYTGFDGKSQLIANVRNSWSGFPGRPNTYTVAYNGPVNSNLALGAGVFSESIGDINLVKMQLSYAFRFEFNRLKVGLGLSTEFLRRNIDATLLENPIVDRNDALLETLVDGQQIFDASVGGHLLYDGKLFLDITLPNTIRTRLDEVPVEEEEVGSRLFKHYIFQLGYIIDVEGQNFKVIPSLNVRNIRDTPYQVDLNVQGRFLDEKLIAGLTLRPNDRGAAAFLIGTRYKSLQLYYSYDLSFSRFQQYTGGSHEISVSYAFSRKPRVDTPVEEPRQ